jgi:hypothetical protein
MKISPFAILILMILISASGCQETLVLPEAFLSPTAEPDVLRPTRMVRGIETLAPDTSNLAATALPSEASAIISATPIFARTAVPTATFTPDTLLVGYSVEGRAITARQIGNGEKILLLVGGIHGGWEANTVALINELIAHFEQNPADILPGMSILLLPVANPDGLVRGREEAGRFNANGVDLNRNWGCKWSEDARWRNQAVNPGEHPFSEPETQAVAALVREIRPATVLFYHSAAGGVFAGGCEGDHGSMLMSQIVGQAADYTYGQAFTAYPVTGTAASWVDGQGIPSADVELQSWTDSEFERNLHGIMAVQCWLISDSQRCAS